MPQDCETKEKQIKSLQDFIKSNPKPQELKRALAVKLILEGYSYRSIQKILEVSMGFISKWKNAFEFGGLKGLKSRHQGSKSYLSRSEKEDIVDWLIQQEAWDISELQSYLIEKYDVVFKSRESYYQILKSARITWQKGEHFHPRQDPEIISQKNQEIAEILEKNREEIESGKLVVYIIDECHLVWQDICGYLWNFIKNPLKIPLTNTKDRQTYYGALNLLSGEFILIPYQAGNGKWTVEFVENLQKRNLGARTLLIWDGASYHRGEEMKKFLTEQNQELPEEEWKVTCVRFAPYAPQENPVEAIWLQLKTLLRRFYRFGKSFKIVKRLFRLFVDLKLFNIPTLKKYDAFSQFV